MLTKVARNTYVRLRAFPLLRSAYRRLREFPPIRALGNRALTAILAGHGERVWRETRYGWFKFEPTWEHNLADVGELDVTPVIESMLEAGTVFYDLGANIGFYTLLASRKVGPAGKVIAFEPDPDNVGVIRQLVERNALSNVVVAEYAASDTSGSLAFKRSAGLRHSGHLAGIGCDTIDSGEQINVKAITLDEYCTDHPAPDVIKIDVEGCEGNVLRGARKTLQARLPSLIIEVHRQEFMDQISAILRELGYEPNLLEKFSTEVVYPCHVLCPSPKFAARACLANMTTSVSTALVRQRVAESIAVKQQLLDDLALLELLETTALRVVDAMRSGHKVLFMGNGGSAADAQHLAAEFTGRYIMERRALPAIALNVNTSEITAIANDYSFDRIFARQIEALGQPGDVAIGLSTSGNARNVVLAMQTARARNLLTVALTGSTGGLLKNEVEVCLRVPSAVTPRIQECHILVGHILCEIVEHELCK